MKIKFSVIVGVKKEPNEVSIGEEFQAYSGDYEIHELSAQEGNKAVNALIADSKELQENPENIKSEDIQKRQIEVATTLNGKPLVITDLGKFPNKVWQLLVAANEKLNGVTIAEARFLLQLSP